MDPNKVKILRSPESYQKHEIHPEVIAAALQFIDPAVNHTDFWNYEIESYDHSLLLDTLNDLYDFNNEITQIEFNERVKRAETFAYGTSPFIDEIAHRTLFRTMFLVNSYFDECLKTGLSVEDLFNFVYQESLIVLSNMTERKVVLKNPYMSWQQKLHHEITHRFFYMSKYDRRLVWERERSEVPNQDEVLSINGDLPLETEILEALDEYLYTVSRRTREKYRLLFISKMLYGEDLEDLAVQLGFKNRHSAETTYIKIVGAIREILLSRGD